MRELVCRIAAVLLVAGGLWGQQSATIAESDAYRVEFLETVDVTGARRDMRHDFAVTPKNGADSFRISTNQSWQFYSLEFAGRLLLIHGALGGNALTTAIVDLDKKETVDSITHWGAWPSPDGRFLAIQLHYPRLGTLEVRSSVLSIYDFGLSADDNRLKPNYGNGIVRSQEVGIPVYPLENSYPPSYNVWVEDPAAFHSISNLGWLSERHLIFTDGRDRAERIVTVDLTNGITNASIAVADIAESIEITPANWRRLIDYVDDEAISLRLHSCEECPERRVRLPLIPLADYRRPTP